jgi:hypothetical protein
VVIDVVIFDEGGWAGEQKPRQVARQTCRAGNGGGGSLEQIELFGPVDRCPTAVHAKLVVDVFGMAPQGIQRHHELVGNVRAAQVGSE